MTVTHMWVNAAITSADNPDYPHRGNYKETIEWLALANVAALCSRAEFKPNQPADRPLKERECVGDASEVAILQYMEFELGDVAAYRKRSLKVAEIPFNSTNMFHVSIHKIDESDPKRNNGFNYMLLMKGAPEHVLARSDSILHNGNEEDMTDEWKSRFVQAYEELVCLIATISSTSIICSFYYTRTVCIRMYLYRNCIRCVLFKNLHNLIVFSIHNCRAVMVSVYSVLRISICPRINIQMNSSSTLRSPTSR